MKPFLPSIRLTSVLVMAAAVTFSACKKNNDVAPQDPQMDDAVAAAQGSEIAAAQFDDVFNISLGVQYADGGTNIGLGTGAGIIYKPGGGETTLGDPCFTVTVAPKEQGVWPKTVTFDFGAGCKGVDGKVRKGKIIAVFTKPAYMPGAQVSTTFSGYEVDSFALSGTHIATNTSTGDHLGFKTQVINGKLTNTNSNFWRAYEGEHEFTQVAGMDTPFNLSDDTYEVAGSANGGNATGFTWNIEITKSVTRKFNCHWRGAGVLTIHWNQNPDAATLDYGNGACDNKATVSYKRFSKDISL